MTITDKIPLARAERLIRARVAAAGEVWIWADAARYRRRRRLAARLERDPVPGGDMALFGQPGQRAIDGGGLLVVTAWPLPDNLDRVEVERDRLS